MSNRYLFWRAPDGKPYLGKDGKFCPTEVLAKIGSVTKVTADGDLQWPAFSRTRLDLAITLAAIFISPDGEELNESDSSDLVRSALIEALKRKGNKPKLDVGEFFKLAEAKAHDFFRKKEAKYLLISSISIQSVPFNQVHVANCKIEPLSSRRGYSYPESTRMIRHPAIVAHIQASNYRFVRIKTSGRSASEAIDRAFRALNLLRGLWSLFTTYRSWSISYGTKLPEPIGVIHIGPIHTLHHPNKMLIGNSYWYERAASTDRSLFQPFRGWNDLEKQRRWAMARLRVHPFRKDVEDLIIRYVIALDQTDHDVAFLQMWSILEKLTNTVANNDETLRRAVWLFKDRKLAKELLNCVRLRRNLYVHAAKSSEKPDQAAYLIKSFVDLHLIDLLRNDFGSTSLEEHGQHLSLPTDLAILQRNKAWTEKAISFLWPKSKK